MSKIKHTLPIAAASIVLTVGSIAGPRIIQTESVAAASHTAEGSSTSEALSGAEVLANAETKTKAGVRALATSPEELLKLLGERIVAKDIDGIIALQEPEAAIVDWDGSIIRGHAAIRAFYIDWFKSNPVLTVNPRQTVVAGGWRAWDNKVRQRTAAIMGDYSLEQDAADGSRVSFTGNFCDTVREQLDGTWLYVQDNPYPPHGDPAASTTAHH
ncbi:YybH family protein [Streptomyces coelicoflavus]|uniref:YybH family protein n=1 Tax=Streptomyces coelicoflavus TaxID=285562 RepID=UPI0036B4E689